jgi:hypothetical protein
MLYYLFEFVNYQGVNDVSYLITFGLNKLLWHVDQIVEGELPFCL